MSIREVRVRSDFLPSGAFLYHQAPGSQLDNAPRLLLITYHFPPDPVIGGLRWQQMTRHFADRGWVTDVITRDFNGSGFDLTRLDRLAPGTRLFSVPDREPRLARLRRAWSPMLKRVAAPLLERFRVRSDGPRADSLARHEIARTGKGSAMIRAYLAWEHIAREGIWARAAGRVATTLARAGEYKIVISSGPPHMTHVASHMVGQRAGIPFVVDMRDPWSMVEHLPLELASPLWYRLARHHERQVLSDAALVTMNTDAGREAMQALYPQRAERFTTIRNGCDDDVVPVPRRDGVFRIRFAGSIYIDRDPRLVFRAAARVISDLGLTPGQFLVEFAGEVDRYAGIPTLTIAEEEGIARYVRVTGQLARKEVLEYLAGASMLLSLPQDTDYAIPAKIYEYMRVDAWMLVLAHPGGATARLLENTEADVVDPCDVDGISRAIRSRFEQFVSGELPEPIGRDGRFDRRVQSEKLIGLIEEIVARHPREQAADGRRATA